MTEYNNDQVEIPELPNGWEWQGGNRGSRHYTTNFGTEYRMGGALVGKHGLGGYSGQIYHDEPGGHFVVIEAISNIDENDDPQYTYPVASETFDSEQEAVNAVPDIIEEL